MNVMDQNQDHRSYSGDQHEQDRAGRNEQQTHREGTAVNIEMPERMHEILQKER